MDEGDGAIYGGFWRRTVALVLDWLAVNLLAVAGFFLLAVISGLTGLEKIAAGTIGPAALSAMVVLYWLYFTLTTAGDKQATPGKRAVGLKVVGSNGARLSWGRANARFWSKILSAAAFLIGFLMVAFTRRKEGLHDLIADTYVVKRHVDAEDLAWVERGRLGAVHVFVILLSVLVILPSLLFVDDVDLRMSVPSASETMEMADEGDPEAQYNLGTAYLKGRMGLDRDPARARAWYRKAAQQGYTDAQFNLGLMYGRGIGGSEKKPSRAAEWFRKAARAGHARAQHALGVMTIRGQGTPPNPQRGLEWVEKAAAQGHEKAQQFLKEMGR